MLKVIKRVSSFILLWILMFCVIPNEVDALSTGYKTIDQRWDMHEQVDNILLEDVYGYNMAPYGKEVFMVRGVAYNGHSYYATFRFTVNYYDAFYNVLTTTVEEHLISPKATYNFEFEASPEVIKIGNTIYDVAYYSIDVEVNESHAPDASANNYEYVITDYNINMIVNENNTMDITEKIAVYFNTYKHGIYRKLPLKNNVTRLDGTTSFNRVKISDISVSTQYTTYNEDGYKVIKIGNPDYSITGSKDYTISYLYNVGKDTGKDYDELYFNLIGDEWDTSISNVNFTIEMPKEFDESKLGFSSGITGSVDSSKVFYEVNGNVITGYLDGTLMPGEALTVRLELPEGYFVGASGNFDIMMIIALVLPIIFVGIGFIIWHRYGRDEQVVETVEFYPPEGFNSLEVGFLYKGVANNQDVTSLLIYLANKGYIKISDFEAKNIFSTTKGFKVTKLKEYDGDNLNEKIFMEGLFSRISKSTDEFNTVTSIDLYNRFYKTKDEILSNMNTKENKHRIFEKAASSKSIILVLMIIAVYCLITIPPMSAYTDLMTSIVVMIFPGIGFTVLIKTIFSKSQTIYVNGKPTKSLLATKIIGLVWGGMFGGMPWLFMILPTLLEDPLYLVIYLVGMVCVIALMLFHQYLPKRTPYGNEILGKLKGFKNFLETVEKDKLEAMVASNPTYFYDILPYTYVLEVSDVWISKFESISLEAPNWYGGSTSFSSSSFGSFMNKTMAMANYSMSSSPSSSSSGGGSSGGGSSGGGSGGGGGGSW